MQLIQRCVCLVLLAVSVAFANWRQTAAAAEEVSVVVVRSNEEANQAYGDDVCRHAGECGKDSHLAGCVQIPGSSALESTPGAGVRRSSTSTDDFASD